MAEQGSAYAADLYRIARIVSSYVHHHQVEPGQLTRLIVEVQQDYVVCLECGFRAQMLRRHLQVQHGLSIRRISCPLEFAI
jgi:predicted transcriptional regulator